MVVLEGALLALHVALEHHTRAAPPSSPVGVGVRDYISSVPIGDYVSSDQGLCFQVIRD